MSDTLKEQIQQRYGAAARAVGNSGSSCCGPTCCGGGEGDQITRDLYQLDQVSELPEAAVLASLGCGNPTALAELNPGEIVLDLGSGGGIDVLLSARRVGPTGKAYGLDMTDDMLALARRNQQEAGVENVEFLKGEIEAIPLPPASVDVIISNCVINLSTDKDRVFAEALRTLRPGGRFAVSDVLFQGDINLITSEMRGQVAAWAGCVAGALEEQDYISRMQAAGFEDVSVQVTRVYDDAAFSEYGITAPEGLRLVSGFVRARKPN